MSATAPVAVIPPLSLYIHIPWCVRKCPYCDFNSHALRDTDIPEQAYLKALLEDLEQDLAYAGKRQIRSVFIGGGTPSLMSGDFYARLFAELRQRLALAGDAEITLEANPGTVDQARFRDYRQAGINRLSLGIQSFQPRHLQLLGRIHDSHSAHRAVESVRAAGFDNFNLDLMHGLTEQTPDQARADLREALAHQPPHLSWYQLTLEPNTEFYRRPPPLPDDDRLWEISHAGTELLCENGYHNYEVSAWSRPGHQCRHQS